MRGAKSLVYAALLRRGAAALAATAAATSVVSIASVAHADVAANHVRDVRVRATDAGGAEIEIVGTGAPSYNVRVADGGRRLLVDLTDSDVAGAPAAITTPVGVVGGVLTQGYGTAAGSMTRLSVSLQRTATYRVVPQGTSLRVILTPSGPAVPGSGPPPAAQAANTPAPPTALVRDVRFERAPATVSGCAPYGCDRVLVDLGSIPAYSLSTSSTGRAQLQLKATALPETLARTLDVTAFQGSLKSITASHDAASGNTVLELDRQSDVSGTISVEGGLLVWSFPVPKPVNAPPRVAQLHIDGRAVGKDGGSVRHVVTVAREPEPKGLPRIETSIHDEDPVAVETSGGGAAGFASTAGGNVLAQQRLHRPPHRPRPQGRRHPQRPAPPRRRRAREHRHRRRRDRHHHHPHAQRPVGSGARRRAPGQGPRHGAPGQPDPRRAARRAPEGARAPARRGRSRSSSSRRSRRASSRSATRRPTSSRQRAKDLLSPRGSIAVDERTNVLIVRDIAGNLNQIEELVRSLDTQTPQVLVEARIVEATSSYLRDVGIQWGGDATFSAATGNPTGIAFPSSVGVAGGTTTTTRRRRASRRSRATSRTRTSRSTCRPRSAPGTAARSA